MSNEEFRNALPIGRELQGYRIDSVLGAGGFGITYKAMELSLDREVAIKEYLPMAFAMRLHDSSTVVPASTAQEADFAWGLARFKQEAQVLIKLRHPNIVPVLRFFEDYGTAYMVMEYQHGDSLGGVLRDNGAITQVELDTLLPPILDALESVHEAGFLHRDLKPDNIYVRDDGSPVILDFGAARQALGQRSQSLTAIVSEGYAPYEQYEREGNQGPWTDIYALGAVLYRSITNQRPVEAPARASAAFRGAPDPLRPAAELAQGEYHPGVYAAIRAAMQILETARPQSIADFREILSGNVEPAPLAARDTPTLTPANPPGQSLADAAAVAPTHMAGAPLASGGAAQGESAFAPTILPGAGTDADSAGMAPTSIAGSEAGAAGSAESQALTALASPPAEDEDEGPSAAPTAMADIHGGKTQMAPPSAAAKRSGRRPMVLAGAIAACLLVLVGGGVAIMSGGGGDSASAAGRDAARILEMAQRHRAEAAMLRNIASAAGGRGTKVAGTGGPLKDLFANRRLQTILPGRSAATLIRFSPGGGLSAVTNRAERDGGDLSESGSWSIRGNAICMRLSEWNSGKAACFNVRHSGDAKSRRVSVNATGRAGGFRGILTY